VKHREPPYYELDDDTRATVQAVLDYAELMSRMQLDHATRDRVQRTNLEMAERFGLQIHRPSATSATVVPLRPFRVVESDRPEDD